VCQIIKALAKDIAGHCRSLQVIAGTAVWEQGKIKFPAISCRHKGVCDPELAGHFRASDGEAMTGIAMTLALEPTFTIDDAHPSHRGALEELNRGL